MLKIAVQMDYIDSLVFHSDSTLLLCMEAQTRGYKIFYYTPDKLTYNNGKITARAFPIWFYDDPRSYYKLGEEFILDLSSVDVVLLRQDPPFDMNYITTTYLLEQLQPKTLIVNDPASVRNNPEKLFPTVFKEFMPPTLISGDTREIREFYKEYKDIIIKPLYGHGGRAVLHIKEDDDNFSTILEMLFSYGKEPIIAQRFLPEVKNKDMRVILIDGEFVGAVGRIPENGSIRANMRVGASAKKVETLTKKQQEICEALKYPLKEKGLILAGLDLIGDFITEINITSPTTLRTINTLNNTSLEKIFWDAAESKLS